MSKTYTTPKKIIIIALIVLGIRLLYLVPVPGVDTSYFSDVISTMSLMGFINLLTGNGLASLSVMAFNVTPYITASIILQLFGNIIPSLEEMKNGMKKQRDKYEWITIILALVFAAIQGVAFSIGYGPQGLFYAYTWYNVLIAVAIWVSGTFICVLLGRWIQRKFKINGVSILLLLNVLSGYPAGVKGVYDAFLKDKELATQLFIGMWAVIIVFLFFAFTYFTQESKREISIVYASRSMDVPGTGNIPIRLCPGSVVPVIFASSLMSLPVMFVNVTSHAEPLWAKILDSSCWFDKDDWLPTIGAGIYILLIIAFSFYYAHITIDSKKIAEDLSKNGGTITSATVRPGTETRLYIRKIVNRNSILGAAALVTIAIIPTVISGLFDVPRLSFFGTSVIITVGVIMELKEHIKALNGHRYFNKNEGLFTLKEEVFNEKR